jgi:hypothetical protein
MAGSCVYQTAIAPAMAKTSVTIPFAFSSGKYFAVFSQNGEMGNSTQSASSFCIIK